MMSYRRPFAQREIVKPYLDKLKENISFLDTYDDIEVEDEFGNTNRTKYVDFYEVMETIDDLLSGEEECIPKMKEALEMAIQALGPESCNDAISRQVAKKALEDRFMELQKRHSENRYETNFCLNTILELPPVNPQPKMGHWKKKEDDICWWYVCSECEQEPLKNRWNDDDALSTFCPNCGAKMQEVEE